jgi:hypothetical protein
MCYFGVVASEIVVCWSYVVCVVVCVGCRSIRVCVCCCWKKVGHHTTHTGLAEGRRRVGWKGPAGWSSIDIRDTMSIDTRVTSLVAALTYEDYGICVSYMDTTPSLRLTV